MEKQIFCFGSCFTRICMQFYSGMLFLVERGIAQSCVI